MWACLSLRLYYWGEIVLSVYRHIPRCIPSFLWGIFFLFQCSLVYCVHVNLPGLSRLCSRWHSHTGLWKMLKTFVKHDRKWMKTDLQVWHSLWDNDMSLVSSKRASLEVIFSCRPNCLLHVHVIYMYFFVPSVYSCDIVLDACSKTLVVVYFATQSAGINAQC